MRGSLSLMSKSFVVLLIAALFSGASVSSANESLGEMPSGAYELDLSHASVIWKVSHFGFSTYPGRFTDFDVALNLDAKDFTNSSVAVDIKVDSIQTAYPYPEKEDFDKELASEWFNSAEHPSITFQSTEVSELSGNSFTINGDLTMLGKSAPVMLNATLNKATAKHPFVGKPVIGFSASTQLDRTQWGLSKYAPSIGAEVTIEIEGEFVFPGE